MTRINANLNPAKLLDLALLAEYRELPMIYAALRKSLRTKSKSDILKSIPKNFTLNTGHVTFFFDKLSFLQQRYELLIEELEIRGYNLDSERTYDLSEFPKEFHNDWEMDDEARVVIAERLWFRFNEKPQIYKYFGSPIEIDTYKVILFSD